MSIFNFTSKLSDIDNNFINYSGNFPNFYIKLEDREKTEQWINELCPVYIKELKPEWAWKGNI